MKGRNRSTSTAHGPGSDEPNTARDLSGIRIPYLVISIGVLALVLRLLHVQGILDTPLFHGLALDSEQYQSLAARMLQGEFLHEDFNYLSPLYPGFLAVVYGLFGLNNLPVLLVQSFLDAFNCLLLYDFGTRVFDKRTGRLASLVYALYGVSIFYAGLVLSTSLILFLLLTSLTLMIRGVERSPFYFFWPGLVFGLVLLGRSNAVFLVPLFVVWFLWILKKRTRPRFALHGLLFFLLGLTVFTGVSTARNVLSSGRASPFSAHGGINFFIGNNPEANGGFMSIEGISWRPVQQSKDAVRVAEREAGRTLEPDEASWYWFQRGLNYLWTEPGDALLLYARKAALFWRHEEIPLNISYPLCRDFSRVLQLPLFGFGLIAPFALMGLALARRRDPAVVLLQLLVVGYMLSIILFYVSARYRLPVVPFLIVLAAAAVFRIVEWFRNREFRPALLSLFTGLLLLMGINLESSHFRLADPTIALHHYNVGVRYRKMGQEAAAKEELRKSLSLNPGFALTHKQLGELLLSGENRPEAEKHLLTAVRLQPDLTEAHLALGSLWQAEGNREKALMSYQKALALNHDLPDAHHQTANLLVEMNAPGKALAHFAQALRIRPDFPEAHNNMGNLLAAQGKWEEALGHYREALRLRPRSGSILRNLGDVFAAMGTYDQALSHYREALRIDPASGAGYLNLGTALALQGNLREAFDAFQKATELLPKSHAAFMNLARAACLLDDRESAGKAFRELEALNPAMARELLQWNSACFP